MLSQTVIFSDPDFTNVIGKLTAPKWIHHPGFLGTGWGIEWETAGSGVFGGNEKGTVEADFKGRHVIFSFVIHPRARILAQSKILGTR